MLRFLTTLATLVVIASAITLAQTPTFQSVSIQPATTGQIGIQFGRGSFTARTSTLIELIEEANAIQLSVLDTGPGIVVWYGDLLLRGSNQSPFRIACWLHAFMTFRSTFTALPCGE